MYSDFLQKSKVLFMTVKERLKALNVPSPLEVTGTRATTVEEWEKIRPIVREMMYKCEYGYIPEKPESVSFKVYN